MQGDVKLALMVAAHLVCGGVLGLSCRMGGGRYHGSALEDLPRVIVLSLGLAQACLLGIWVALTGAPWRRARLERLIAGVVCLEILVASASDNDEFRTMPTVVTSVIMVVLLAARARRLEL